MKLIGSLIVLLASAAALATPAVGDVARFNVKLEQNGAYMTGEYEVALLAKDAAGNYKMRTVVTMEDSPAQTRETMEPAKNFLSDAVIQGALANCEAYGGRKGQYTIPGSQTQTVPTCVIPSQDDQGRPAGEIHVAMVAFGLVKQIQVDSSTGLTITLEMISYTNGK